MSTATVTTPRFTTKNVLRSIFGSLSEWTIFERVWITIFFLVNLSVFLFTDGTVISLVAAMAGMICVVLVAKGKISNYFFGFIQAALYGYISYTYAIYGEVMLNWLFYIPMQFIGFYLWRKNAVKSKESVVGEQVIAKKMDLKKWAILVASTIALSVVYAFFLSTIGGRSIGLDSVTTVLSIVAQILMIKRFVEQWLVWIVINILTITMWIMTMIEQGGNNLSILVMWIAFLVNSVYGYINWRKIARNQKEEVL